MTGRLTVFSPAPGISLRTHHAPPAGPPIGTVVLAHGRAEFVEKYAEVVDELTRRGLHVWTFDWRGQGLSSRLLPDRHKGHIDHYDTYVSDLAAFARRVVRPAPGPRLLLAHSMGGNAALRFLAEQPDAFDAAVLTAPLVDLSFGPLVGGAIRLATTALMRLGRAAYYAPGRGGYGPRQRVFEDNVVTSDPVRFRRMHEAIDACPDLAIGGPTVGWLAATFDSGDRLERAVRAGLITTPVLVALGGAETLVDNAAARRLVARLPRGEVVTIPGSRHEVLIERDPIRDQFWAHFDRFVGGLAPGPAAVTVGPPPAA